MKRQKTVFIKDISGMYAYRAARMAKDGYRVLYYVPNTEDAYLTANRDQIGTGIPGVTKVYDMWEHVSVLPKDGDVDFFYYPDVGCGSEQRHLEALGYPVSGSKGGERMEIDKAYLNKVLKKAGLAVPPTESIDGFDNLREYMETHKDKWLKVSWKHRGIFETFHHKDWASSEEWFYRIAAKIGQHRHEMEILAQDPVKCDAEIAIDGWRVLREMLPGMITGIEEKDKGFAGMIVKKMPWAIAEVEDKLADEWEESGYTGEYGNEIRAGKELWYIDTTARTSRPPGEIETVVFENFGEIVEGVANGEIIVPKFSHKYVAHVLLCSPVVCNEWVKVSFPKEIEAYIQLAGYCIKKGEYWCIPDGSGHTDVIGAAVGVGNTLKAACKMALENAKQVEAEGLEFQADVFDKLEDSIRAAEKYGINL